MIRPTCCLQIRTGVILLSVGDIIFSLAAAIVSGGGIVLFEQNKDEILKIFADPPEYLSKFLNLTNLDSTVLRIFLGFNAFYWLQKIWLGVLLLTGAIQERHGKLRLWFVHTFLLIILSVIAFLASISLRITQPLAIPFYIGAFIVREYVIWTVYFYIKELQVSDRMDTTGSKLFQRLDE